MSTIKERNIFNGLDLIDRVPDELWTEVLDIVQETGNKTIPQKRKYKKAKWLSEEASQIFLSNILSRLVRAFLPSSKHLLISWLQSQSAMTLQPKKRKSLTVSIIFPSICHEVMGPDAMIFVFVFFFFKC